MAQSDGMQFFAGTDSGRRRAHNEDNYLVDKDMGLCMVADGMGGHAAGEVASAVAVRTVHEVLREHADVLRDRAQHGPRSDVSAKGVLELLELAVQTASAKIHAAAKKDRSKQGMGTTLSILLVLDSCGYVAHVGDSRIYLERDGKIHQVTEDHTIANELLRLGMVTPDRLEHVPQKNAITRAVGVYAQAEVDTLTIEVLPRDQFLLASDGLTGYFQSHDEVRSALGSRDGQKVVQSLIDFANARGGKDNITCVLMRVGRGDEQGDRWARRLALKREAVAQMPLFSRLSERELLKVLHVVDVLGYRAGDVIMREGEAGEELYVVLSGRLQVSTGQAVLGEVGPGEHLGEMALIRSAQRSATVMALEDGELITLKRRDLFEIIRNEPQIAVKLLWQFLGVLAGRLAQTSQNLSLARQKLGAEEISEQVAPPPEAPAADDPFSEPGHAKLGTIQLVQASLSSDEEPADEPSPAPTGTHAAELLQVAAQPSSLRDSGQRPTLPLVRPSTIASGKHTLPSAAASGEPQASGMGKHTLPSATASGEPQASPAPTEAASADERHATPAPTEAASADEADLDLGKTIPCNLEAPVEVRPGGPSGATPAEPLAGLHSEIDELRKRYRERLRAERAQRDAGAAADKKKPS